MNPNKELDVAVATLLRRAGLDFTVDSQGYVMITKDTLNEGVDPYNELWGFVSEGVQFSPSTWWDQGGPLLEFFRIAVEPGTDGYTARTNKYWWPEELGGTDHRNEYVASGVEYLRAAMKVLVKAAEDVYGEELDPDDDDDEGEF